MPSHQDRREPLPESYQFGDAGPKLPHHVTLSKSAFHVVLELWEKDYLARYPWTSLSYSSTPQVTLCLNDTVFHRGDY